MAGGRAARIWGWCVMFISRSRYNELLARTDTSAQAKRDAETTTHAALASTKKIGELYVASEDRIRELEQQLARAKATTYTDELAAKDRLIARLQAAYDNAVGLDAPVLDAGARWQERREDKPRTAVTS